MGAGPARQPARPVLKDIESNIEAPRLQTAKTTVNKRASPSAAMSSPINRAGGSFVKRKTVITATGQKKIVQIDPTANA